MFGRPSLDQRLRRALAGGAAEGDRAGGGFAQPVLVDRSDSEQRLAGLGAPVLDRAGEGGLPLPLERAEVDQCPRVDPHRALRRRADRAPQIDQGQRSVLQGLQQMDVQGRREKGKRDCPGAFHGLPVRCDVSGRGESSANKIARASFAASPKPSRTIACNPHIHSLTRPLKQIKVPANDSSDIFTRGQEGHSRFQ